jgi:hypothetical protein
VLWVPAVILACLWALIGGIVTLVFDWTDAVAQVPAPDSPYKAVVTDVPATIPDPAWAISVRQTGSLTAKDSEIGCVSGDDPEYMFRKATWTDAEHLSVKLSRHTPHRPRRPGNRETLPGQRRGLELLTHPRQFNRTDVRSSARSAHSAADADVQRSGWPVASSPAQCQ